MISLYRFFLLVAVVAVLGMVQAAPWFNVAGVKPNLILASLVACAFFVPAFSRYLVLLGVAIAAVKFTPSFEIASLALAAVAFTAFVLSRRLPGHPALNAVFMAVIGVALFYAITNVGFLYRAGAVVAVEMVYTGGSAALLWLALRGARAYA